jgi:hypothetical protein
MTSSTQTRSARAQTITIPDPQQRPTITVPEAGQLIGLSRPSAYEAARRGDIPTLKIGRRRVVPTARLLEMLGIGVAKPQDEDVLAVSENEASERARIAASERWAHTSDRRAATAPARAALNARFEAEVDPDGTLDPAERAQRVRNLRVAYYTRLARLSAASRRKAAQARRAASGAAELRQMATELRQAAEELEDEAGAAMGEEHSPA